MAKRLSAAQRRYIENALLIAALGLTFKKLEKDYETQLVAQTEALRQRVVELEDADAQCRQTQAALQVSETRYRRLFETAQDGILILDANTGQIADVNPFLIRMLGYSHAELLGKRLWEIGPFKDIAAARAAQRAAKYGLYTVRRLAARSQ